MAGPTALAANRRVATEASPAPFLYRALRGPVRRALARWFDLSIEGLEHLPAGGPYLIAANHHNYLDGVVLGVTVPHPISFLVMPRVWHATPVHPLFHRHIGSIAVDLDRPDPVALRRALETLGAGGVVGIFPEGPWSVRGQLEPGLPGVGLLALRSGAPVVPAAIRGTYEALVGRRCYVPRRHPLAVRFGSARRFTRAGVASAREARQDVTEQIMADIAHLLG